MIGPHLDEQEKFEYVPTVGPKPRVKGMVRQGKS